MAEPPSKSSDRAANREGTAFAAVAKELPTCFAVENAHAVSCVRLPVAPPPLQVSQTSAQRVESAVKMRVRIGGS